VGPVYANEIPIFVEMTLKLAVKGALNRFADAAREMDIRGGDDDPIKTLFDIDDAVEWVLRFFVRLLMARKIDHIRLLLGRERAAQGDEPSGILVVNPMTSLANHLVSGLRPRRPMPASGLINGAALQTDRRLRELLWPLVRIEYMIFLRVSPAMPAEGCLRPRGSCVFHDHLQDPPVQRRCGESQASNDLFNVNLPAVLVAKPPQPHPCLMERTAREYGEM
jgi:hypothetical protein